MQRTARLALNAATITPAVLAAPSVLAQQAAPAAN